MPRAGAIALLVFGWLAFLVVSSQSLWFDIAVRDQVHAWASPPLTAVLSAVTRLGEPAFLTLLTVVVAWWLAAVGRRREAVWLAGATIAAVTGNELLKLLFHRYRPAAFFGYAEPSSYSFPSGHSLVSCCFYGLLAAILAERVTSRALRLALWSGTVSLVLLIGFSRVYLGVHYASDVAGGYALGLAWAAAMRRRLRPRPNTLS